MSDLATALLQLTGRSESAADPALAAVKLARASIDALILRMGQTIDARVTAQLVGGLTQLAAGADSFVLKLETPVAVNTAVTLKVATALNGQPAITVTAQPQPPAAQPAPLAPPAASPPLAVQTTAPATPQLAAGLPIPGAAPVGPTPAAPVTPSPILGQAIPAPILPQATVPPSPQLPPPPAAKPATTLQQPTPAPAHTAVSAAPSPQPAIPAALPTAATMPSQAAAPSMAGATAAPALPSSGPAAATSPVPAASAGPGAPALAAPAAPLSGPIASPPQPIAANLTAPASASPPASATAAPPVPTAPVAPLPSTGPVPTPTPAQPLTSAEAARPAAPPPTSPPLTQILADPVQAAARQDSVLPLLARLATLSAPAAAALPRPVLEAIARVLAGRLDLNRAPPDGKAIRDAVLRAGVITEPGARTPADARSALLQLRSALSGFLGGEVSAIAPVTRRPPPPLKGEPVRAPSPRSGGPSPEEPLDTARQLLGHADAAISRLKLLQLASNPADAARPNAPAPAAEFRVEVPMQLGAETGILQLLVERDGKHKRTPAERGWRMRFALNFSTTGEVGAEIALLGQTANVALWAAEPATAEALEAMLPELAPALAQHGLAVGNIRVRRGAPQPTARAPGQLLDSAR